MEKGVLNATPEQIQEWQEADETLDNIRKLIEVESMEEWDKICSQGWPTLPDLEAEGSWKGRSTRM